MVRSDQPLVERHGAGLPRLVRDLERQGVSQQQQMIDQSNLFRSRLLRLVPRPASRRSPIDPAMLQWLNGVENNKWAAERELRPRDDGAVHPRRRPRRLHRERRPRTGPGADRLALRLVTTSSAPYNFRFDPNTPRHRSQDGLRAHRQLELGRRLPALRREPVHPSFFVTKLWSYFVPHAALGSDTLNALITLYISSSATRSGPVARGDPHASRLLRRPGDGEAAGRLPRRPDARQRPLHRHRAWTWLCADAGQQLFWPPNVSGWDDTPLARHHTMRARWLLVTYVLDDHNVDAWDGSYRPDRDGRTRRWTARSATGATRRCARSSRTSWSASPSSACPGSLANWQQSAYRALRQNALRQLIGVSPDLQLH